MSQQSEDDPGCLIIIGLVITAAAVGHIWGSVYGWLAAGITIFILGVVLSIIRK